MVLRCSSGMTQSTLVETCSHNLQTALLSQIGVTECHNWKQLVLQGVQAEEIVARVKTEEKESKPRSEKPTDVLQNHLLSREEGTLWKQRLNLFLSLS